MIASIFTDLPVWATSTLAVATTFVLAYVVAELIARAAWRALRLTLGARAAGFNGTALRRPIRLLRVVAFLLIAATLALPMMEIFGIRTFAHVSPEALVTWLVESGVRIGLILLLSYLIIRITALVLSRFEQDVATASDAGHLEQVKRLRTLGNLLRSAIVVIVWTIATLMVLKELRLDITPVLTTAGILGLAVGFGAQTLVKDVISGFFMILENQVRVGDVASINGTGGAVESITLRTITLRDETGTVHIFPNGGITTLANLTKDFSFYVLNIGVDYAEDTDRVVRLLTEIAADLQREARFAPSILAPLEIIGVDDFQESAVMVKARIKTLPLKQWEVGRELRRRIKQRFDAEQVAFPFRTLTVRLTPADEGPTPPPRPARPPATGFGVPAQAPKPGDPPALTGPAEPDGTDGPGNGGE